MLTTNTLILIFWTLLSTFGTLVYLRDVWKWHTTPHSFTWFIWSLIQAIAFGIQLSNGGGWGSVIMGWNTLGAVLIFLSSLKYKGSMIRKIDYVYLILSLLSLVLWLVFDIPVISVILLIFVDFFAYIPTIRKSYSVPHQETLLAYITGTLALVTSLYTFDSWTFVNYGSPLAIVVLNAFFVAFVLIRRRQIQNKAS